MTDPRRAFELFDTLVGLPEAERSRRLAEVAATEPELARQVKALLRADRDPAVLSTLTEDEAEVEAEAPTAPAMPPQIGRYRLIRRIGSGAMGEVYEAEQEAPRRRVALKRLKPTGPAGAERFRQEAEVLARIDHEGVARVVEAGGEARALWFAMELVDGQPITAWAEATKASVRDRVAMVARICDALAHVHAHGIIHRDLKPDNVLVSADGRPKVIDFGIARVDDAPHEAGALLGTPAYMAPEQLAGQPVDPRVDVHALGLLAYELLAGRLPYPLAGPLPEVMTRIREGERLPLRQAAPRASADLEAIVARATAREPEARYPSAAALAEDLRRWLEHLPVRARPPGPGRNLTLFARRSPRLAAALGALVAALIALLGTAVVGLVASSAMYLGAERGWREAERRGEALRAQNERLVIAQARAHLRTDPTAAAAWVRRLPPGSAAARDLAWVAHARGTARDLLVGHGHEVRGASFTPDGRVLTASYDGRVRVWDLDRREVQVLDGHPGGARLVVALDAGLASAGEDGTVRIERADGSAEVEPAHVGAVEALAPGPAGLATAGEDGQVRLRTPDGRWRTLRTHARQVEALAWDPSGARLASAGEDGVVGLVSLDGADQALRGHVGAVTAVAWGPDGALVSGGADGTLRRWTADGPHTLAQLPTEVRHLGFVADGRAVASDRAGSVHLIGAEHTALKLHDGVVRHLAVDPRGRWVATGGEDGAVGLLDTQTGARRTLRGHAQRVRHVAFSADGGALVSASADGTARVWTVDLPHGRAVLDGPVLALAPGPGGAVALGSAGGEVGTWAEGALRSLGRHDDEVEALAWLDGAVLSGSRDGSVRAWTTPPRRWELGEEVDHLVAGPGGAVAATGAPSLVWIEAEGEPAQLPLPAGVEALGLGPTGQLAVALGSGQLRLGEAELPAGPVTALAFGADGRLALAGADGAVSVVEGGQVRELGRHAGAALAVAWDGAGLLSGGVDRRLLRHPGGALDGPQGAVTAVAVGPEVWLGAGEDGWVRAWGRDGSARAWDLGSPVRGLAVVEDWAVAGCEDGGVWSLPLGPAPVAWTQAVIGEDGVLSAPWSR